MRFFIDFTVINALLVQESNPQKEITETFIKKINERGIELLTSNFTIQRVQKLPKIQKEIADRIILDNNIKLIDADEKVIKLSEEYLKYGLIERKSKTQAGEVAIASTSGASLYVSWDYQKLGRYFTRKRINSINLKKKAENIDIGSPLHAIQLLETPSLVDAVHKAQDEVHLQESTLSPEDEIKLIRKTARKKLPKKEELT